MSELEELIQLCERIAKRNGDEFKYRIELEPGRHGFLYRFDCYETEERHSFITGSGANIRAAVKAAREELVASCEEWGYIFPV
jgi:hypothetical protein